MTTAAAEIPPAARTICREATAGRSRACARAHWLNFKCGIGMNAAREKALDRQFRDRQEETDRVVNDVSAGTSRRLGCDVAGTVEAVGSGVTEFEPGRLAPVVDRVFPFSELAAALDYYGSGEFVGKVVTAFDT